MKVLCNFTPCGPSYVRAGWGRVFKVCGHDFLFWNPETKSAFDVFAEYEPDLYIGTTYEVDRAVFKNIASRPQMRVILFASAWGPYLKDVDLTKYPLVVASEQEKATIERLKRETGRPDFVFIHAHDRWLEGTMSGWGEIGVKYLGVLNAADALVYLGGRPRREFACSATMCGGYWPYKARNLDAFVLPLCHPNSGVSVKLFGNSEWPVTNYVGGISMEDERDLYLSAKVCLNVSEPHSTDMGWDCIERPWKVLLSGGFCISDWVEEMRDLFSPDELPMFKTANEFHDAVRHFARHVDERGKYILAGRTKVLSCGTYHHRVAQMLSSLGLQSEATRCLDDLAARLSKLELNAANLTPT